jgi:GH24 family phage-related lysozyme (muramidase)
MNYQRLKESIIKHEGKRNICYRDHLGHLTLGYGHLVKDDDDIDATVEYSDDFIMKLLEKDLDTAINDANSIIDEADIPEEAFEILVQMCFQLGKPRVLKFKRFLYHLNKCEFVESADEMIDSLWYQQTPNRVSELAEIMRNV